MAWNDNLDSDSVAYSWLYSWRPESHLIASSPGAPSDKFRPIQVKAEESPFEQEFPLASGLYRAAAS
jgi:hypothetical protein